MAGIQRPPCFRITTIKTQFHMKNNISEDSMQLYLAPECEIIAAGTSGLLCASDGDTTGTIDPWQHGGDPFEF